MKIFSETENEITYTLSLDTQLNLRTIEEDLSKENIKYVKILFEDMIDFVDSYR